MSPTQNPFYVTGGTLSSGTPSYVERHADSELYEGLKKGEFCYILTSRQMGKSSLMVRTADRLPQENTVAAILDLTAIGQNLSAEQWYDGLLGQIGRYFNLDEQLENFWLANERVGPMHRWMRAIREVVLPHCKGQVVIFVDEIDAVRRLPFSTDEFFAGIREFYNRRTEDAELNRLTFCLLGVATPSDLIRDTRTTPFNIGRRIELRDFTDAEATPLAKGLHRQQASGVGLLRRILHWTGGHPYLTQRLCLVSADDPSITGPADVDRICKELFLSNRAREQDDNLLFVRERLLRSEVELAGLLDCYSQMFARPVLDDETNPLISVLRLSGVARALQGRLETRNRIYQRVFDRRWVEANMPDAEKQQQRRAYRRGLLRAGGALGVILLIVSALGLFALHQTAEARNANDELQKNKQYLQNSYDDLQAQTYTKNILFAEQELGFNQDVGKASTALEECSKPLRKWEWNYLTSLLDGGRPPLVGHESGPDYLVVRGHDSGLWMAVFSPDGGRIATSSIDGTVNICDVASGKIVNTFRPHARLPIMSLAFSPDGKYVVSGSIIPNIFSLRKSKGDIKIWEAATNKVVVNYKAHVGMVTSVAFSPDGSRVASSSVDPRHTFDVWDAKTGKTIQTIHGHTGHVHRVRFSPDGSLLISSSADGTVKLWNAATFQEVRSIAAHPAPVFDVAFRADGARFATAGLDGTAHVWNTATGELLKVLKGHTGSAVGVAFSPDGARIATAGFDKTVRLWDAATGKELIALRGHHETVFGVAFSPDGLKLVSCAFDGTARIWDTSPHKPPVRPDLFTLSGHKDRVNSVAFSPDGRFLASGSWDFTVRVWDAHNGKSLHTLDGHRGAVWSVAFSPDSKYIASASWDQTVKLWDAESGRETRTVAKHDAPMHSVAFSPDGKRCVCSSWDGMVKVWDTATGKETAVYDNTLMPVMAVAFSPDKDNELVAAGGGEYPIKLWKPNGDQTILNGHVATVHSLCFSPDGKRVASASWDQTAKIWDVRTGKEIVTLKGHTDRVQGVAFSPDGKRVATASDDKTIRVWDATTGLQVMPPLHHRGAVVSVAFSPDGKRVASGCWTSSGQVQIWSVEESSVTVTERK